MLANDLQYDRMESAKEKEKLIYTRLSVKKKKNLKTLRSSEVFQFTSSSWRVDSVNLA